MRRIVLFILTLASVFSSLANNKNNTTLEGIVLDKENEVPIELANIFLMTPDSAIVAGYGAMADSSGYFSFQIPTEFSTGFICVSFLGYAPAYQIINISQKTAKTFVQIFLEKTTVQLSEIAVEASPMLFKTGKKVGLPTNLQKKIATNGFDLLSLMSFPQLNVDRVRKTIMIQGRGDVQVRINNQRALPEEIFSIRPENVVRVEFYDIPSGQYANEEEFAVLNFIIKRSEEGGYVSVNTNNGLSRSTGMNSLIAKFNYKKSELGINYSMDYQNLSKKRYDESMILFLPTQKIQKESNGINKPVKTYTHNFLASYNLTATDSYIFNLMFKGSWIYLDNFPTSTITYITPKQKTHAFSSSSLYNRPKNLSVDIYFEKNIINKQRLSMNIVGTRIVTDYDRTLNEIGDDNYDYKSIISGYRHSILGNIVYEKNWTNINISGGAKFSYGHTQNNYTGTDIYSSTLDHNDLYLYTQLKGELKKFTYATSFGASRYYYDNKEGEYSFYNFHGDLELNYQIPKLGNIGYQFLIKPSTPPIAGLNDVTQNIDRYQVKRGNPFLKPYSEYLSRINLNLKIKNLAVNFAPFYDYYNHPIMDYLEAENSHIYISTRNEKSYTRYGIGLDMTLHLFHDLLILSGSTELARSKSIGWDYNHSLTTWYGYLQALFTYKNWNLLISANNRSKKLWGETIEKGGKGQLIELGYTFKSLRAGLGIDTPFEKEWNKCTEVLSIINPSQSWMRMNSSRVVYLNLSWSISLGRKHKIGKQQLNNRDTGGSGVLMVQ